MSWKLIGISGLIFVLSTFKVAAGVSSGWLDYFVGKVGQPGSASFDVMQENGLILSRYKNNYVAFTFGETRLSETERASEPVNVSEFDFVVEYEVCSGPKSFFESPIYKLNYRYHTDKASTLMDEILDINEFFNRVRGNTNPRIVSSTKENLITNYSLGIGSIQDVDFQTMFSKDKHYIEISVTANNVCKTNN